MRDVLVSVGLRDGLGTRHWPWPRYKIAPTKKICDTNRYTRTKVNLYSAPAPPILFLQTPSCVSNYFLGFKASLGIWNFRTIYNFWIDLVFAKRSEQEKIFKSSEKLYFFNLNCNKPIQNVKPKGTDWTKVVSGQLIILIWARRQWTSGDWSSQTVWDLRNSRNNETYAKYTRQSFTLALVIGWNVTLAWPVIVRLIPELQVRLWSPQLPSLRPGQGIIISHFLEQRSRCC